MGSAKPCLQTKIRLSELLMVDNLRIICLQFLCCLKLNWPLESTLRLLLINPNTSQFVTDAVMAEAGKSCPADTELVGTTGESGAPIIGCRTEDALATNEVLELASRHYGGCDAIVLAVSFDSGLHAARELMPIPVVGMTEAAIHMACLVGGNFGVLTFGDRAGPIYSELLTPV